jgi:hypothetical protein
VSLVTFAFNPVPLFLDNWSSWGRGLVLALPFFFALVVAALLVFRVVRGRDCWLLLAWTTLIILAFLPQLGTVISYHWVLPKSVWQLVAVPTAVAMAVSPLLTSAKGHLDTNSGSGVVDLDAR